MRVLSWVLMSLTGIAPGQETPRALPVVEEAPSAHLERAVSRSEQFRVTGGEGLVRGTVAMLAEEAKNELLQLTEEKDEWKVPVWIRLHGQAGDEVPLRTVVLDRITFSEAGYRLGVHVHVGRGVERELLKNVLTEVLLYERALRNRPVDSEVPLTAPSWLVEGLREAAAWKAKESDRRLYDALFKHGGVYELDDLFAADRRRHGDLDAAMRAAFRVSSGALVMALLDQPQGKEGFRSFLSEAAAFEGEMPALLRKHFPELNLSETSLSKWWMLQLANRGTAPLTDILSVMETEKVLAEGLRLNFRDAEGSTRETSMEGWREVAELKDGERREAVKMAEEALVRLSYRCFPSYRPLLVEYQALLASIAQGKTGNVAARLAALEESREVMLVKARQGRDFMDWFEITRASEKSGAFDEYLRLKSRLRSEPRDRGDGPSKYLDRMDEIFHREEREEVQVWNQ